MMGHVSERSRVKRAEMGDEGIALDSSDKVENWLANIAYQAGSTGMSFPYKYSDVAKCGVN